MNTVKLSAIAGLCLALAACSSGPNPDDGLFGPGGGGAGMGPGGGFGAGAGADPSTVAFFNQQIGDRVFFALDQSSLSSEATATLQRQVQWLAQNPQFPILIEGHADERGTREYNLALGARRAASVRNFMVANGIPDSRISTITYGKERPEVVGSDERSWQQNRRAVTVITSGFGV